MLFAIGTRVRFRFTGESGVITARLDEGMLQVRLDSDPSLEIPAFEEDLRRDTGAEPVSPGAKFVAGKADPKPPTPPRREVKGQYVILRSKGIQLGFEPMPGRDGTVSKYKAWLINDTKDDVLADFQLFVKNELVLSVQEKLTSMTALDAGDILFDDLNDAPEVEFSCQRFTTAGLEEPIERFLKIRAKQFFNHMVTAPVLNVPVYHFLLVGSLDPGAAAGETKTEVQDLKSYTKQKLRNVTPPSTLPRRGSGIEFFDTYNVEEYAHFEPEIDLHIENLVRGYAKMDKSMMLRIQLEHFEKFLEKAIRLGVHRVFAIHGVGEGKLKDAIAEKLREYPQVHKFKNEFHSKYGYGATEIIFH